MTLKKVVITGLGIVSSIGVGVDAVLKSLKEGKSGIKKSHDFVQPFFHMNCIISEGPSITFFRRLNETIYRGHN